MTAVVDKKEPLVFDEFFELGFPEAASPFLTPASRRWGYNLSLKNSFLAAFFLILSFALSFFEPWIPLSHIFLAAVYFLVGIPPLIESIQDILDLEINIDTLMTFAAFSSVLIGSGLEGGLLLVLFDLSGSMEESVTAKAKGTISALHKLVPTRACVIDGDGTILERSIKDIPLGTRILIKAGEVVPLDGEVLEGSSSVNLVHLTGESLPVTKKEGDKIPAGARNQEGALVLKVTHTSNDSTLARIIQLVTQAQESKPQLQRWFDKLSARYATTIIFLSLALALVIPLLFSINYLGVDGSIYRALAFLIAASPCALIIAIPIAYLSAISACARRGILLKGGITLDALASCSMIAFDKTGTLTLGELTCVGVEQFYSKQKLTTDEALGIAYALEKNAVHPIAKAITNFASEKKVEEIPLKEFRSIPGFGLTGIAKIGSKEELKATIGHPDYIASLLPAKDAEELKSKAKDFQKRGELLATLLIGDELFIFRFTDVLRPNIKNIISSLKKQNWRLVMLTGDHSSNAQKVANELGIDDFYADLRPEDKLQYVSTFSHEKGLAMVGDGINDAPALARATVGICMGKVGSASAAAAADVVLLQDNLESLEWLMSKAKKTKQVVKQNLCIAVGAILIAALPALAGLVPLWLAVVLHEGGTIVVGLNALRLLR